MNLIKKRKIWFAISGALIIAGIVAYFIWGFKLAIDFTGGSLLEIEGTSDVEKTREFSEKNGLENVSVTTSGENNVLIRSKEIEKEVHEKFSGSLKDEFGEGVKEISYETIGPTVSKSIAHNAFYAVILASVAIIFYIGWAFRKVTEPVTSWQFGITAVITLVHDVLIVTAAFIFFGKFFNIEVDSMFVTALLTTIGYSVHDTIVVFDRARENWLKGIDNSFEKVLNISILETVPRSLNTSITTLFVLIALFLFGGVTIRPFILALIIGAVVGTYSSIFIASPLLIVWQNLKERRLRKEKA